MSPLIRERRPDVNIWFVDYDSSLNAWLQPAMPQDQIGGSLLMHAKDQGLGTRPIHWVGHSMGGLIIKYLTGSPSTVLEVGRCVRRSSAVRSYWQVLQSVRACLAMSEGHYQLLLWKQERGADGSPTCIAFVIARDPIPEMDGRRLVGSIELIPSDQLPPITVCCQ